MSKKKIDEKKLIKLCEAGKSQGQIAKELKVHKATVSRAVKRMNLAVAKAVVKKQDIAPVIVEEKIDIIKQIQGINRTINCELDWIKQEIDGSDDRLKLQDQMVKFAAEVRKQMSTLLDVAKTLYNAEEAQAFQRIVLQAIEDADPGTKEKIIQALYEIRSVGRAIRISEI
jgi:IS30 family transposase